MVLSSNANANFQYNSPVDFQLPVSAPDGLPVLTKSAFDSTYNTLQQIISVLVNYCGIDQQLGSQWNILSGDSRTLLSHNMGRLYVQASENLAFGAAINLHNVAGALRVRNANATNNTKPCDGFCSTIGGITSGSVGEVILHSGVIIIAGLTVASRYYLSLVNGLITAVAPVAAGNIEQYLGIAIDTTHLFFSTHYWIQH